MRLGHSFSLSLNYRRTYRGAWLDPPPAGRSPGCRPAERLPALDVPPPARNPALAAAVALARQGGATAAGLLRRVLETCETCEAAEAALLSERRLIAPCYVMLCGAAAAPGRAVLLTCGTGHERAVERMRSGGELAVASLDLDELPRLPPEEGRIEGSLEAKDFVRQRPLLAHPFLGGAPPRLTERPGEV